MPDRYRPHGPYGLMAWNVDPLKRLNCPHSMLIPVSSIQDPCLNVFRDVKESALETRGLFLAEGLEVTRRLLRSEIRVESVVVTERRVEELAPLLLPKTCAYVLPHDEVSKLVGFDFHSGVMGCGVIPGRVPLEQLVPRVGPARLVVLPEIGSSENLGTLIRLAAGMGADGMIVGERCTSPWMRRAIRVSMGSVFSLPVRMTHDVMAEIRRLREEFGVETVGTVLGHGAETLGARSMPKRVAVLFGSERHGLREGEIVACDRKITIPMSMGVDSLNVGVSAAVVLWEGFRRPG